MVVGSQEAERKRGSKEPPDPKKRPSVLKNTSDGKQPSPRSASPRGSSPRSASPRPNGKAGSTPTGDKKIRLNHLRKNGAVADEESDGPKWVPLTQPVDDFFVEGLLPATADCIKVASEDTIGAVVGQLLQCRERYCIVAFSDERMEFFDCTDLNWILLEKLTCGSTEKCVAQEWATTKAILEQLAQTPVREALRAPRGASAFQRFDVTDSFERLLMLLRTRNRVPIYRGSEMLRVITASDVLEMFCYVKEEMKTSLEQIQVADLIRSGKSRGFSDVEVTEQCTTVEVLSVLQKSDAMVAPVLEAVRMVSKDCTDVPRTASLASEDGAALGRPLVGLFDVGALRILFLRSNTANDVSWWWEDPAVVANIMFDPCMDFLARVPALWVSMQASVPYHSVTLEESLGRAISRILASDSKSVVVLNGGADKMEAGAAKGALTTHGLLDLMLEAGYFRGLKFDAALAKGGGYEQGARKRPSRKPSRQDIFTLPAVPVEPRRIKVRFSEFVELDHLHVPVCVEHGPSSMKYVTGDGGVFFHGLMELLIDDRLVDASAQCCLCGVQLGRISLKSLKETSTPSEHSQSKSPQGGFFYDFGTFGAILSKGSDVNRLARGVSDSSVTSPGGSCLKSARQSIKQEATPRASEGKTSSSTIFGFCCAPCTSGAKDRIVQTTNADRKRNSGKSVSAK